MDTVQFGDYIFPHNPKSIRVSRAGGLAVHFCPGRGDVVQDLGKRARRIRCEGCFFGRSYEETLDQLVRFRKRAEAGAGSLLIPGMEPVTAYLLDLEFQAQGDGRIIPYRMVFQEGEHE